MPLAALIILVVALHYLFVATAVFGALLVLRWRWFALIQIPILIWAVLVTLLPWTCPLTALEKSLRAHAGRDVYSGGFLSHYVDPGLSAAGLVFIVPYLGLIVLAINLIIYGLLILRFGLKSARAGGTAD